MERKLNRKLLDQWLEENGPDGVTVLAYKSKVSASTIQKARASESAPKKFSTLQRISKVMGLDLEDIFPQVSRGRAS